MVQATERVDMQAIVAALYKAARCAQVLSTGDPLDPGTARILSSVVRTGPVRLSAVAQENHIDLSTASRHIDTLVRRGLVAKSPDPTDARATLLDSTQHGRQVLKVLLENRSAAIAPALVGWAERDRRSLERLLVRLAGDLDSLVCTQEHR